MEPKRGTWRYEHPEAKVPEEVDNHPDLHDTSYHNDAMPRFMYLTDGKTDVENGENYAELWVDYEDGNVGRPNFFAYDTVTHGPIVGFQFNF